MDCRTKISTLIITTLTAALMLSGCDKQNKSDATQTSAVSQNTNAVEATEADYSVGLMTSVEPYSFRGETGEITGFNVDVLNAIAHAQDIKFNYVEEGWDANFNFDYITNGNVDIVGTVVVSTPELKEIMDFTSGYITSGLGIAVNSDNQDKSFADLIADTSITYSASKGGQPAQYIKYLGIAEDKIVPVKTQFLAVRNVFNGNSDAAVSDINILKYFANKYTGVHLLDNKSENPVEFSFAVKKGNKELLDKLNNGLETIKQDGTYQKIYDKWFNPKP